MECPFCAETIKDEAIVCKHCSRDLRAVIPIMIANQHLVTELAQLRLELGKVYARLAFQNQPVRFVTLNAGLYILVPSLLLLIAHALVTLVLDTSPIYLRIASVIIPVPFGMALYSNRSIGLKIVAVFGILTALLSVTAMLIVVGTVDKVSILPASYREWREAIEYSVSIALAYETGGLLAFLTLRSVSNVMAASGRPNALAFRLARVFGHDVGHEVLRRRARRIQEIAKTVGPFIGLLTTAAGSIYTGLKGFFGTP